MKNKLKPCTAKTKLFKAYPSGACFKDLTRISKECSGTCKPKPEIREDDPDIMPAFGHDIGNYVARYGMGSYQIQVVMKLNGRLDFDKLSKAVKLTTDEQPVLGCRFVVDDPPYWKRIENIQESMLCSLVETDNAEEAVEKFLESRLDMDNDPMVKVALIRSDQYDTLGIKINHACSDGGGTKEYVHLLAHIYSCLDRDGYYEPNPVVRSRKDHEKAFRTLGIENPKADKSIVDFHRTVWPFPWKAGGCSKNTPFVICRLPKGQLDVLSKYGKARGATINDLIVTAFYRAMFKITQPPYGIPMDMGITVDLRRYLPDGKAEAIRNFSGGIVTRIPRVMGESFEKTLARVVSVMKNKKARNPGYKNATAAERMEQVNFYQSLAYFKIMSLLSEIQAHFCFYCSPVLSNIGIISKSPIKFGKNIVTDAYIIPPVVRAPGFLLVASSYNGTLTLAAGYYEGSISRWFVKKLLNQIRNELMEACRQ